MKGCFIQMAQIKAVLSDIGNVIMPVRTEHFLAHLADAAKADLAAATQVMNQTLAIEHEVNRGRKTIREVFDEFIAGPLDIEWEHFLNSWYALLGEEYPQVRNAYERLTVPLYVLSNINDVHAEYLHGRWFDEISIACWMSNEIGMAKPSSEVYEFVLAEIKCKPEELLFFDDLQDNIDAAAAMGINAVLVKNPDDVVKTLEEYDLLKE